MSLSKISEKLKVDQLFQKNGKSGKNGKNGKRPAYRKPKAKFLLVNVEEKLKKYMEAIAGKDACEFTVAADTDRALKLLKTRPYHMLIVASPHVDPGKVIGDELLGYIRDNKLAKRITFLSSDEEGALMPKIGDVRGRLKRGKGKPEVGESVKRVTRFRKVPLTTQHIYQVVNEVARNPFELPDVTLLSLMGFNDRLRLAVAAVFAIVLTALVLSGPGDTTPDLTDIGVARVQKEVVVNPLSVAHDPTRPPQAVTEDFGKQIQRMKELSRQVREALKDRGQRPKGRSRPGHERWGEDRGE